MSQTELMPNSIGFFIDHSNLNFGIYKITTRKAVDLGTAVLPMVNYEKLITFISKGMRVSFKNVYMCRRENAVAFEGYLLAKGFQLITKKMKLIFDVDTREERRKADLDVEITRDIVNMIRDAEIDPIPIPFPGTIVLVSGDSDFKNLLVEDVKARGIRVIIVATRYTLSIELREIADEVILLEDIWESVVGQ